MKPRLSILFFLPMLLVFISCGRGKESGQVAAKQITVEDSTMMMPVATNIIDEVIVRPDTLGDPWEVEKVKGFAGEKLFRKLLDDIYSGKLTAWDCRTDEVLKPEKVKELEKEFNSDLTRIGKLQFVEDWYFDMGKNSIVRKVKSVAFGYSSGTSGEARLRFNAFFRIKTLP